MEPQQKNQETAEAIPTRTTKAIYLDKKDFLDRIIVYRKECRKAKKAKLTKPKIPDHLAKSLMLIAENAARHPHYSRYTFKDIMIADAVENCIRYFDNFNPRHAKKNPFGYFSQCCIYAFWRRIGIEKAELYGKYKLAQQSGVMDDFGDELGENGSDHIQEQQLYDNINDFIRKYEDALKEKKKKKAERKALKKPKVKGLEKFSK